MLNEKKIPKMIPCFNWREIGQYCWPNGSESHMECVIQNSCTIQMRRHGLH